jgi:hypothetical protein
LLEPQRTNLFRNSEYFGYWTNYGGSSLTITPNYSDSPEGVSNSYRLQKNAFTYARLDRTLSGVSSGTLTYSLFVKGDDVIKLRVDAPSETPEAFIDCSDGTITNHSNTPWDSISSVDYGDGWYRFICTHTFTNTPTIARIYPMDAVNGASNTNAADVQVYGAQLEEGSYATSYIPTYGSAVTRNKDLALTSSSITLATKNFTIFVDSRKMNLSSAGTLDISYKTGGGRVFMYGNCIGYAGASGDEYYCGGTLLGDCKWAFVADYDAGHIKVFLNGQLKRTDTSINLSRYGLGQVELVYLNGMAQYKNLMTFPTALTDQEAIDLTTL